MFPVFFSLLLFSCSSASKAKLHGGIVAQTPKTPDKKHLSYQRIRGKGNCRPESMGNPKVQRVKQEDPIILPSKNIGLPVRTKEANPEYSLEGLMLKLKFQYFGHLTGRVNSLEKFPPWCWKRLTAGEGGNRGWDGWIESLTQCVWI